MPEAVQYRSLLDIRQSESELPDGIEGDLHQAHGFWLKALGFGVLFVVA
jgi:hypothetical protein